MKGGAGMVGTVLLSTEWPNAFALQAGLAPNAKMRSAPRAAGTGAAVWLQESAAVQKAGWEEPATRPCAVSLVYMEGSVCLQKRAVVAPHSLDHAVRRRKRCSKPH